MLREEELAGSKLVEGKLARIVQSPETPQAKTPHAKI